MATSVVCSRVFFVSYSCLPFSWFYLCGGIPWGGPLASSRDFLQQQQRSVRSSKVFLIGIWCNYLREPPIFLFGAADEILISLVPCMCRATENYSSSQRVSPASLSANFPNQRALATYSLLVAPQHLLAPLSLFAQSNSGQTQSMAQVVLSSVFRPPFSDAKHPPAIPVSHRP